MGRLVVRGHRVRRLVPLGMGPMSRRYRQTGCAAGDIAIEQARARGLTVAQTAALLGVEPIDVAGVWAAMDAAVGEPSPEVKARRTGRRGRPIVYPCGTRAAYERHRRHHEPPCEACRRAKYLYSKAAAR